WVCPDHVSERKPHPEPLFLACREIGAEPEKAVCVGDHERDIEAGRNAGMHTIAVRYGYIEQPETVDLWHANNMADTVSDPAEPEKAVYVGDHERDIEAGPNAGMHTIAVRYGYIEQPETVDLWQADIIADTVSDLAKLLQ